ncbi:MAG TPA: A/G-specific adenine glycosylase [Rhizomicrobium sp.]|jgi:A/G-specific adenine glycosylase
MPSTTRARKKVETTPAAALLAWYDRHRRVLPWRARAGERADPYRVWLSEIMLQQTTVQAVGRYYRDFLRRWPDVGALAAAPLDDVLGAWAGLGYYARARNLHRAAKFVVDEFGGAFPSTLEELRKLPGIGAYTAAAIASIAFDVPALAMDANAERVLARYFALNEPPAKAKPKLREMGEALVPQRRAGDFAQALMDLGALICSPKKPACLSCPWFENCEARKRGIQELLPVKSEKPVRPMRRGAAFVVRDPTGAVLLMRRPEKGLLGGMLQPPLGPWTDEFPSREEAMGQAPVRAKWKKRSGIVRHGFTHFELEIEVYVAEVSTRRRHTNICHSRPSDATASRGEGNPGGQASAKRDHLGSLPSARSTRASPGMTIWVAQKDLANAALPTVMRKIIHHAIGDDVSAKRHANSARRR